MNSSSPEIHEATLSDIEQLSQEIHRFNREQAGEIEYLPLGLVIRDEEGQVLAGVFGEMMLRWFNLHVLWVEEEHRGHGWATRLLEAVEEEVRQRGCVGVFLDTFSWQAEGFYFRKGYQMIGKIEDCPPGHRRVFFQKRL